MDQPTAGKPKRKRRPKRSKSGARPQNVDQRQDKEIQALKKVVAKDQLRVDDTISITEQLAVVHGVTEDKFQLCSSFLFNPLLLRGLNGDPTPLSDRASKYERFRWSHVTVGVIPLCQGGIAGSTLILAIDYGVGDVQPRATYSMVMMTPHREVPLGASLNWNIDQKILSQGRKGGWFVVDTDAKPFGDTCPFRVSVYVFGQSRNIYGATAYDGPLWRVTVKATAQLSMYNFSPGLNSLASGEHTSVTFSKGENGELHATLGSALHLNEVHGPKPTGFRNSIWLFVGVFGEALKTAMPGWSWLIEGGVVVLKALFKTSGNGDPTFTVHPSIDDAAEGHGMGADTMVKEVVVEGRFSLKQVSTVNPGPREPTLTVSGSHLSMPFPTGLTPWALSENSRSKDVSLFGVGTIGATKGQFITPTCAVGVVCSVLLQDVWVKSDKFVYCVSSTPPADTPAHVLGLDDGRPALGTWDPGFNRSVPAAHWYSFDQCTAMVVEDNKVEAILSTEKDGIHLVSFASQWFVVATTSQKGWLPHVGKSLYISASMSSTVGELIKHFSFLACSSK